MRDASVVRGTLAAGVLAAATLAAPRPGAAQAPPRPAGFDVLHYDLDVTLPDTGRLIRGVASLRVARGGTAELLALDFVDMRVDGVTVDGRRARFERGPETLRIRLPRPGPAAPVTVRIRYHGEVTDGLIVRTDALGRWTAFGDNWPDRARHWIPSVDRPDDKATVDWTVRAPSARTVVANGVLVERRPLAARRGAGGRTLTRWSQRQPIPTYLMVIGAAPLAEASLGETACGLAEATRCVPQSVYVRPELRDRIPPSFAQAGAIVAHFARLVAPFPYEKLAHVQSNTIFGGMENAGAIFYDGRRFERGTLDVGLVAHETAHQWFGDAVTQREWGHLWLSEGFATYFAALWAEHARGDSAFREELRGIRARVLGDTANVPLRPVLDSAQTHLMALLNANSYQKGGFVLHMLRRQVGDSAFFRGVRRYYAAHRHGNALTDDLRAAMEAESGAPLGWFFDQWLRRPGYPELAIGWAYDSLAQRVRLEVEQLPRFGTFRLPLTVAVVDAGGEERRVRVEIPAVRSASVMLPLPVQARPARLLLDPDVDLLAAIRER